MLRFDHMPSDFNEHFLILGTPEDLVELAEVLRGYAAATTPVDLSRRFPGPANTASVRLEQAEGHRQGLHKVDDQVFLWGLMDWQASVIADGIDKLNADCSGSEIFQLGADGEIPVKVSHGEFTDDFLVSKR